MEISGIYLFCGGRKWIKVGISGKLLNSVGFGIKGIKEDSRLPRVADPTLNPAP